MPRQATQTERLTKTTVRAAQPTGRRYRINDTTQPGFYLFVYPSGRKSFGVRYYTHDGKQSEKALGDFPTVTPEVAREQAAKLRSAVITDKADPVAEKREARKGASERRERTIEVLVADYIANERRRGKKSEKTIAKAEGILKSSVLPRLGKRPVADVDHIEITEALEDVQATAAARSKGNGAGAYNDARKYLLQVFKRARFLHWIDADPMELVEARTMKPRDTLLSDDQLRALWEAWDARKAAGDSRGKTSALAFQFLTLTLQRGEEVAGIHWTEIDLEKAVWVIPAERHKQRKEVIVPLSEPALVVLDEAEALNPGSVGPFVSHAGGDTIRRDSLTQSFSRECDRLGIKGRTPHDLRRTGRTAISDPERLGFPPHIGEAVLSHVLGSVVFKTYDRNAYLTEKRKALNAWAGEVERIVYGTPSAAGANVVPLRKT